MTRRPISITRAGRIGEVRAFVEGLGAERPGLLLAIDDFDLLLGLRAVGVPSIMSSSLRGLTGDDVDVVEAIEGMNRRELTPLYRAALHRRLPARIKVARMRQRTIEELAVQEGG